MEKVIIFGRGRYYRSKQKTIEEKFEVIGYIDNAVKEGEGLIDDGKWIRNPKEINKFGNVSVVIMSVKFFEMWKQLMELGISENRVIFGCNMEPAYDEVENFMKVNSFEVSTSDMKILIQSNEEMSFFSREEEYKQWLQKKYKEDSFVKTFSQMPVVPISRRFGLERGRAIDRYYIEKFLEDNKECICGDIMEIADTRYTSQYGHDINNAYILHINGWGENVIKGDFETGEGIKENMVDCLIFTQTLQHIYNMNDTLKNIYKVLKPGGTVLITNGMLAELSQYDYYNWGEYWRLTKQSLKKLLCEYFDEADIQVISYGNVKTAIGFLYGLCREDLQESDFEYNDEQYPLIVAAIARKKK